MILNSTTPGLETAGAVFEDNAKDKTLYCGLSTPDSWAGEPVELTVEKVGSGDKCICKTDDGEFTCPPDPCDLVVDGMPVTVPNPSEVKVKITLSDQIIATTAFRCSVSVGSSEEDQVTDTKLIYAQKIS